MKIVGGKRCSCGRSFGEVPRDHVTNSMGYWFNCSCRSTQFVPFDMVRSRVVGRKLEAPVIGPHSIGLVIDGKILGSKEGTR